MHLEGITAAFTVPDERPIKYTQWPETAKCTACLDNRSKHNKSMCTCLFIVWIQLTTLISTTEFCTQPLHTPLVWLVRTKSRRPCVTKTKKPETTCVISDKAQADG